LPGGVNNERLLRFRPSPSNTILLDQLASARHRKLSTHHDITR